MVKVSDIDKVICAASGALLLASFSLIELPVANRSTLTRTRYTMLLELSTYHPTFSIGVSCGGCYAYEQRRKISRNKSCTVFVTGKLVSSNLSGAALNASIARF